jgi:Domain of unknown function DUF83
VPYDSYSIHVDSEIKLLRNIKKFNRLPHVFLFKTGIAVEYVSFGLLRKVIIRSSDRREVLQICRHVEKIKAGFMPERTDRKDEKFCKECNFAEQCTSEPSLMSKFF